MREVIILLIIAIMLSGCTEVIEERKQTVYGSGFELTSCEEITEKDIYELCQRIYDRDPEEFEAVYLTNRFHQHVGPNNIYGAKMALYAKELLNGTNINIQVISEAGTKPPISCLNDGIMVAIGATYGRGLIENYPNSSSMSALFFYNNKTVRLEVKPEKLKVTQGFIMKSLIEHGGLTDDYFRDVRRMGLYVWENFTQEELFIVTYPTPDEYYCYYNDFNLKNYYNQLHNYIHTNVTNEDIIQYIDDNPCVYNGSITINLTLQITATWKENNQTVMFEH